MKANQIGYKGCNLICPINPSLSRVYFYFYFKRASASLGFKSLRDNEQYRSIILGDFIMAANALVSYHGLVLSYAEYVALRESEH